MATRITRILRSVYLPIAVLSLVLASACGSPSVLPPPVPAQSDAYRVSGLVTDEGGAPVRGATIVVHSGPNRPTGGSPSQRVTTRTGGDGRYELFVSPEQLQGNSAPVIRAYTSYPQYTASAQLLERQGTSAVKNFCLRAIRTITAGQSTEVGIDASSSLCDLGEVSATTVCELLRVRYPDDGRLTVEAHGGDVVPALRIWRGEAGAGVLSIPVSTGDAESIDIAIAVPIGTPPQRFEVTTALR